MASMDATGASAYEGFNATAYFLQPPPWQNSPEAIRSIVISVTSVAVLCVVARLSIRLVVVRLPGWDDLFVVLYLITTLTSAVTDCIAPSYGLGKHLITFTKPELRSFLITFYIGNAAYVSSTAFMKLSLLFQFLRVFAAHGARARPLRRVAQTLIVGVAVWGGVFSFLAWVPCLPVRAYWSLTPGDGTCYGFGISTDRSAFVAHTAINMALDVCVLLLPVAYVGLGEGGERAEGETRGERAGETTAETKTAKTTKTTTDMTAAASSSSSSSSTSSPPHITPGILVLLLLGALVNVFAAWRLVLIVLSVGSPLQTVFDSTYYAPNAVLLAALEVNLASICASVPVFWPVLRQQVVRIVVTREVEVRRESGRGRDDASLSLASSSSSSSSSSPSPSKHYDDAFVRDYVDPFRPATSGGVETLVRSDTGRKKRRWWS